MLLVLRVTNNQTANLHDNTVFERIALQNCPKFFLVLCLYRSVVVTLEDLSKRRKKEDEEKEERMEEEEKNNNK